MKKQGLSSLEKRRMKTWVGEMVTATENNGHQRNLFGKTVAISKHWPHFLMGMAKALPSRRTKVGKGKSIIVHPTVILFSDSKRIGNFKVTCYSFPTSSSLGSESRITRKHCT